MNLRMTITGNIAKVLDLKKKDGTPYLGITIAVSANKDENYYVTTFIYGLSESRRALFTVGSLIFVTGKYSDEIKINPNTNTQYINRVINDPDFDILFHKRIE